MRCPRRWLRLNFPSHLNNETELRAYLRKTEYCLLLTDSSGQSPRLLFDSSAGLCLRTQIGNNNLIRRNGPSALLRQTFFEARNGKWRSNQAPARGLSTEPDFIFRPGRKRLSSNCQIDYSNALQVPRREGPTFNAFPTGSILELTWYTPILPGMVRAVVVL